MENLQKEFENIKSKHLQIDMTRGKPCEEQLNLSNKLITLDVPYVGKDGVDIRNYGLIDGITEARELMGELLEQEAKNTLVIGNSSLTLMHDTVQRAMQFGVCGAKPWDKLPKVKFICPTPGYDRHFKICEEFGIEMINVDMTHAGPDIDTIEKLVSEDEAIKGIWCVPQYSNPTGVTYQEVCVRRLATMQTKASDFRIFWDNAYCVHHLSADEKDFHNVLDIAMLCKVAGHEDRYYKFCSLSKVTFPGSSIAAFASSSKNIEDTKKHLCAQMIGSDKINQMRHAVFFKNKQGVIEHMKKHAEILRPKFEIVKNTFSDLLGDTNLASWSDPNGGYFISFNCKKCSAKEVVKIAGELGVKFTQAGATFPHGIDPSDENIRIAPSLPSTEDVAQAMEVLALATKIATYK